MSDPYPPPEDEPGQFPRYQPYQPPHQPPYGAAPVPYAFASGYGFDPATGRPLSDKSKVTAGMLNLVLPFVGVCGVGRLYQGQTGIGLTQLLGAMVSGFLMCVFIGFLTFPIFWIWSVIDGIVLLTGRPTDQQGRLLR